MTSSRLAARSIAAIAWLTISPAVFHSAGSGVAAGDVDRGARRAGPPLAASATRPTSTPTEPTTTSTEPTTTSTRPTTTSTRPTTTSTRPTTTSTRPTTTSTRSARSLQPSSTRLQQAEAIADTSGWEWRQAGVVIHTRFHPQACCHWGIYDFGDNSVWIGPSAFANPTRLRYTVLHELGHAWQRRSGEVDRLSAEMAPWGYRGMAGLEAGADCISVVWGTSPKVGHYWACPPAAVRLVARRLAGDWGS